MERRWYLTRHKINKLINTKLAIKLIFEGTSSITSTNQVGGSSTILIFKYVVRRSNGELRTR
jgi:hypothetical protein